MSVLFEPIPFGYLVVPNRFICSATYEVMALETGEVTDKLINRYRILAKGKAGLVIPGYFYVHPLGRAFPYQAGIHIGKNPGDTDDETPGRKIRLRGKL